MVIAEATGERRYLDAVPSALDYLEKSALSDGRLARYYELETNKPLYMERKGKVYALTYDDSRLPSHYGWKTRSRVGVLREAFALIKAGKKLPEEILSSAPAPGVKEIVESLDEQGRWISEFSGEPLSGQPKFRQGERYLHSGVFARNLGGLARALRK